MDQRGSPVGKGAVVRLGEQLSCQARVDLRVGYEHLSRAIEPEGPNGCRRGLAREGLVPHQPLERHRPHPARLGDAGGGVWVSELVGQSSSRQPGDEGVRASEADACSVSARCHGA